MSHFPTPKGSAIVAVSDEWGVTLETPVGPWETPEALLEACDDFERADRIWLALPSEDGEGRLIDITEELVEAWLAAHADWTAEDLEMVDAVDGVHGKIMRWLVDSRAYTRALDEARRAEAEEMESFPWPNWDR